MKSSGLLILFTIGWCSSLATAGEAIVVGRDGSVSGHFPCGGAENRPAVFRFGLPVIPADRQWREENRVRTLWVTNGIRYTQTVLVSAIGTGGGDTDGEAYPNEVLFVNIEGENTNADYAEASANLSLELNGKRQEMELKDGLIRLQAGNARSVLCALEIPASGIKKSAVNLLEFGGNMPPSLKGSMTVKIPLAALASEGAAARLNEQEFQEVLRRSTKGIQGDEAARRPRLLVESERKSARTD